MAENSAISWTDHTFNPWWGCTKVGPGCDHCYAESFDRRVGGDHWGAGKPRRLVKDWSKPRKWQREAERTGVRPWVFCASMADVFDNEVPEEWRECLWSLVRETPLVRWIFVTKRIGNASAMVPSRWPCGFEHVGLVSTVVNQAEWDRDSTKLLSMPAAWRGLSIEPMLGPIDLELSSEAWVGADASVSDLLHWVIVGGESGPGARPISEDWATDIRDQCDAAAVSFHFKQWSGRHPHELGRLLDGREHNGMPPIEHAHG